MQKNIPVVMVCDNNFISQTKVAIYSMRQATDKKSIIHISILCSSSLDMQLRMKLMELELHFLNLEISFHEIDETIFSGSSTNGIVPIVSYFRLFIANVIKNDKCIFLDGDMIINIDLNELYSIDIESYYIAGVKDPRFALYLNKSEKHRMELGLASMDMYINAGTIIFNLKRIREDHLQNFFLQELNKNHIFMDQDILNKICYKNIKLISSKYNVFADIPEYKLFSSNENIKSKIIHFTGTYKPWNNIRVKGAKLWWAYAKRVLEKNVYQNMYSTAEQLTYESDWTYILQKCKNEKEIVIIGYSDIGRDVYESLKRCKIISEFFFCDNSKVLQGDVYDSITVTSIDSIASQHPNAFWINTSQRGRNAINQQLLNIHILGNRILVYKDKNEDYYETLDEEFVEYERQQLNLKNNGYIK